MLKNVEACQKIAEIVKTSLGPNGIQILFKHFNLLFPPSRNEKDDS